MAKPETIFKFHSQEKPEFGDPNKICENCWWASDKTYGSGMTCNRMEITKVDMVRGKIEVSREAGKDADKERHGYSFSENDLKYASPSNIEDSEKFDKEKCGLEGIYFLDKDETQLAHNLYPDKFYKDKLPIPDELEPFLKYNEKELDL